MIARTTWGRALCVFMSIGLAQAAVPAVQAAAPAPSVGGHVVDETAIARRLLDGARSREERVKLFQDALGTEEVQKQARAMGANPDKLRAAVPHLSDRELADLAARAAQVKQDVVAGHHGGNGGLVLVGVLLLVVGLIVLAAASQDSYHDPYWDDCWCY